jgi:hypothetical protein
MIACAGCTSSTTTAPDQPSYSFGANPKLTSSVAAAPTTSYLTVSDRVMINTQTSSRNKYDWLVVSGKIYNANDIDVSVYGHVDFYDKNDVKFDSVIFSAKPDAHGYATFSATSTDAEDYSSGVTYVINMEHIYKN